MKLLAVISTIDMKYRMGPTCAWWQLLKALHEEGHEVTMTPYLGRAIETPWWNCYANPCQAESDIYNSFLNRTTTRSIGKGGLTSRLSSIAIHSWITPRWEKHLVGICEKELPDAILFLSVPLNHIAGIPNILRDRFQIPMIYYDGDLPMSLPEYDNRGASKFSMYRGVDIGEYDVFLSCSKGILPRLKELGAKKVDYLYYAADPSIFRPVKIKQDIDVFYHGFRSVGKEKQMDSMIKYASLQMPDKKFVVAGQEYNSDMGNAICMPSMPLNVWNQWCCRSRINLNITKSIDAGIYGSSSARIFELAAMGCCIASDKYNGMKEWFNSHEIQIIDGYNVVGWYRKLLKHNSIRESMGKAARARVIKEHTYRHKASRLIGIISGR